MTLCELIPCESMTGETLHVLQALVMQGVHTQASELQMC
jgi:hypothetical protein